MITIRNMQRGGYGTRALPNWMMFGIVVANVPLAESFGRVLKGRERMFNEAGVLYLTCRIELPIIR